MNLKKAVYEAATESLNRKDDLVPAVLYIKTNLVDLPPEVAGGVFGIALATVARTSSPSTPYLAGAIHAILTTVPAKREPTEALVELLALENAFAAAIAQARGEVERALVGAAPTN